MCLKTFEEMAREMVNFIKSTYVLMTACLIQDFSLFRCTKSVRTSTKQFFIYFSHLCWSYIVPSIHLDYVRFIRSEYVDR